MIFSALVVLLAAQAPADGPPAQPDKKPAASAPSTSEPSTSGPSTSEPGSPGNPPKAVAGAIAEEAPRVLLLDLSAVGIDAESVRLITGVVSSLAGECDGASVITGADLRAVLEVSAAQQASGCDEQSCLVELADALGARYVLYGDVGTLGDAYVVTLNLLDAHEGKAEARRSVEVKALDGMASALRPAVNDLLSPLGGIPLAGAPAGPSPMLLVGGVTAGAGALAALGLGAASLVAEGIASDPKKPVADKEGAIGWGRITLVGAIAGVAVTGVGIGVLSAGLASE